MSGGYFNYDQYRLTGMADEIDKLININDDKTVDEWGVTIGNEYAPETIEKFKLAAHTLRQAAEMVQRIDWLVSCDDGEVSFHRRWDKEVRKDYSKQ